MSTEGPNTPEQLDIIQQMNKMLQEQVKILQNISGAMGAQAGAAFVGAARYPGGSVDSPL